MGKAVAVVTALLLVTHIAVVAVVAASDGPTDVEPVVRDAFVTAVLGAVSYGIVVWMTPGHSIAGVLLGLMLLGCAVFDVLAVVRSIAAAGDAV